MFTCGDNRTCTTKSHSVLRRLSAIFMAMSCTAGNCTSTSPRLSEESTCIAIASSQGKHQHKTHFQPKKQFQQKRGSATVVAPVGSTNKHTSALMLILRSMTVASFQRPWREKQTTSKSIQCPAQKSRCTKGPALLRRRRVAVCTSATSVLRRLYWSCGVRSSRTARSH